MLVGQDFFATLTSAITATQTTIPLSNNTLVVATGNHTYLRLDDGTKAEIVKVTSVSSAGVVVERGALGTTPLSFVKGVCVKSEVGFKVICEMIAQGGCTASVACTPVSQGVASIPNAVIGKSWTGVVSYQNATSVAVIAKPTWATETISGSTVILQGTPPMGSVSQPIVVRGVGCNNSISLVNDKVVVCEQLGV